MGHAQGDGACDGNETEMGGLHPKGEPATFYCSHRCLLIQATLVRGASGVCALARPAQSLLILACLARLLLVPCLSAVRYLRQDLANSLNVFLAPSVNE